MPGLLLTLATLSSLFLSSHAFPGGYPGEDRDGPTFAKCKAAPGTESWPSARSWANLNESTGGRLIGASPPGAVCHQGQPTYDADKCPAVRAGWLVYDFHAQDPISNMWNEFSNDTCLPFADTPCSPAGYPAYALNATTADHVKQGLDFGLCC